MNEPYNAAPDISVLPTFFRVPGMGVLPINAFVILSEEPVLVDAGIECEKEDFMKALKSIIDPSDLKWIWLTHDDLDHTGNIKRIMELSPKAKLVTHAFSAFRLSTAWSLPWRRVQALSLGEGLNVGDRILTPIRPPLFDNPMSTGIYDEKSSAFFSVDSFGALLGREEKDAAAFREKELAQGITIWETFDSPWVHSVDEQKYAKSLEQIRKLKPRLILSGHLPVARDKTDQLLKVLSALPSAQPFTAPNQALFAQIVAGLTSSR
jgi:flavorubredoxin